MQMGQKQQRKELGKKKMRFALSNKFFSRDNKS